MRRLISGRLRAGILALAVALTASLAAGQSAPPFAQRKEGEPVALAVSAKATEKPALQYALLPKVEETEKGNAAVKYADAAAQMPELKDEESELLSYAGNAPLEQLHADDSRFKAILTKFDTTSRLLSQGARLESANWETNVRRDGVSSLIPSLGKYRVMAEALALEARFDIQRHDWAAAREKMDTGYALARHLGQGETLIESLVGVAIAGQMNRCAEDWVAEAGSPNIYWALTNLPAPFNDMRRPMSFERAFVYFSFPEMKDFEAGHFSRDGWLGLWGRMQEMSAISGVGFPSFGPNGDLEMSQLAGVAMAVALYPEAKRFLLERGMTKEDLERMPSYEALERYLVRSFEEESDETFKNAGLPGYEAARGFAAAAKDLAERSGETNLLASILVPSLNNVNRITGRCDRQIAMLRIVEALRAYTAEKGSFPATLEALTLPVPLDPSTGKAFEYQLNDGVASIISANAVPREAARYDVTLRK